jgi:protein dithiol:quinone oxidoreductase
MKSNRLFYLVVFLISISLLSYGYYLQFVEGLEPCPLCIFQRVAFIAIIAFAFIGTVHSPQRVGRYVYSSLILISALVGATIAGRQVWLQHLPADLVPECGPGLDFMLDVFPLGETLKMVFTGSGECAKVDWTFLGFSIAELSLAWFVTFALASVLHMMGKLRVGS